MVQLEYRIEKYRDEFRDQVVRLQTLLWSPDEDLNRRYFEWKYERNPYARSPHIYVALLGDKVVGMRGMVGARWQLGSPEKTAFIPCAADLVIHPDHRSLNLLMQINQAALDDLAMAGHEYVFNLSANQLNFVASLATGWRAAAPMKYLVRPPQRKTRRSRIRQRLKKSPFIRKHLKRIQFIWRYGKSWMLYSKTELEPFQLRDKSAKEICSRGDSGITFSKTPRSAQMANLVSRLSKIGCIQRIRDAEYFNWRFEDPLMCFHFIFFWDEEELKGYLVTAQNISPYRDRHVINLLDLEAANKQVRAELLHAALTSAEYDEMLSWTSATPNEANTLLEQSGFIQQEDTSDSTHDYPSILVRAIGSDLARPDWVIGDMQLLEPGNWDIRLLDSL